MNEQAVLENARRLLEQSGLTYQQVGERMGYPPESARQSVWQFLNSTNPSVAKLIRFASAIEVDVKEML